MCKQDEKKIPEKVKKELLYKPYKCRIIWTCIVSIVALISFSVFAIKCDLTKNSNICVLIILSLITICSFIFFGIVLFKDDQGIKFAKLNELARISEKLETISEVSKTNITIQSTADKDQKCFLKRKACRNCKTNCEIELINYKYELFKKYMDTLVDI